MIDFTYSEQTFTVIELYIKFLFDYCDCQPVEYWRKSQQTDEYVSQNYHIMNVCQNC